MIGELQNNISRSQAQIFITLLRSGKEKSWEAMKIEKNAKFCSNWVNTLIAITQWLGERYGQQMLPSKSFCASKKASYNVLM